MVFGYLEVSIVIYFVISGHIRIVSAFCKLKLTDNQDYHLMRKRRRKRH